MKRVGWIFVEHRPDTGAKLEVGLTQPRWDQLHRGTVKVAGSVWKRGCLRSCSHIVRFKEGISLYLHNLPFSFRLG